MAKVATAPAVAAVAAATSCDAVAAVLLAGTANRALATAVAAALGRPLAAADVGTFADGETRIAVHDNLRGRDVYLLQPTCPPRVNDAVMELLLLTTTARRASAGTVTAVVPYWGYARADRKLMARVPIAAADVAHLLVAAGVDRVVSVDLHCGQIQGMLPPRVPCDNLSAGPIAAEYFAALLRSSGDAFTVVSPDAGGVPRAKEFSARLDAMLNRTSTTPFAFISKSRSQAGPIELMLLVGDVKGLHAVLVDDIVDSARTLVKAAITLRENGAARVFAFATHAVLSGDALTLIEASPLERVVVTDTIPLPNTPVAASLLASGRLVVLSVAPLLADAIRRVQLRESLSSLFALPATAPVPNAPGSTDSGVGLAVSPV